MTALEQLLLKNNANNAKNSNTKSQQPSALHTNINNTNKSPALRLVDTQSFAKTVNATIIDLKENLSTASPSSSSSTATTTPPHSPALTFHANTASAEASTGLSAAESSTQMIIDRADSLQDEHTHAYSQINVNSSSKSENMCVKNTSNSTVTVLANNDALSTDINSNLVEKNNVSQSSELDVKSGTGAILSVFFFLLNC